MQTILEWCRKQKVYMSTFSSCIFGKYSFSNEICYKEYEHNNIQDQKLEIIKKEKTNVDSAPSKVAHILQNEKFDMLKSRLDLSQSNVMKCYRVQNRIAHGVASTVYRLECLSSNKSFAIKIQYVRVNDRKAVTRELNTLKNVENHPFLIQLKEFEYLANSQILLFVMECANCDLRKYIKKNRPLPVSQVHLYSQHLLDGISFLHDKMNVMHCDLKPDNLLICGEYLKIGDFGLCRPIHDTMDSYLVTRWYRCPELLNDEKVFDERIDIWSFGCIVWEMMFSQPLFHGLTGKDVMDRILFFFEETKKFESCRCDKISQIMTHSIVIDYEERWSASKLLWIFKMQPITMRDEHSVSIDMNTIDFESKR